jgi:hypothetical protein
MQPLVAPRRMKCVPPECDFLYKDHQDVSQRTVYILRALSPDRKRFVPLAAPRQVDTLRSRVGNTHLRAGALTSSHYHLPHPGGQRHASGAPRLLWD